VQIANVENLGMDDLAIRRPDLRDILRLGTVRWWSEDKGYGRITADDGEVLFVSMKEGWVSSMKERAVSRRR